MLNSHICSIITIIVIIMLINWFLPLFFVAEIYTVFGYKSLAGLFFSTCNFDFCNWRISKKRIEKFVSGRQQAIDV